MDRVLQFLPRSRIATLYASDGAWRDGSYLVSRGIDQRSRRTVRRAADPAHSADDDATGNAAIQIDCRAWKKGNEYAALKTFTIEPLSVHSHLDERRTDRLFRSVRELLSWCLV